MQLSNIEYCISVCLREGTLSFGYPSKSQLADILLESLKTEEEGIIFLYNLVKLTIETISHIKKHEKQLTKKSTNE